MLGLHNDRISTLTLSNALPLMIIIDGHGQVSPAKRPTPNNKFSFCRPNPLEEFQDEGIGKNRGQLEGTQAIDIEFGFEHSWGAYVLPRILAHKSSKLSHHPPKYSTPLTPIVISFRDQPDNPFQFMGQPNGTGQCEEGPALMERCEGDRDPVDKRADPQRYLG